MEEKEIKEIMNETCFGSLSYCCGFEKKCKSRDDVIKRLGLDRDDIIKLKKDFDKKLFEKLKKG